MQRFFLDPANIQDGQVRFPPDLSHQIESVLRMKLHDDVVVVLDDSGREFEVRLDGKEGKTLVGQVQAVREAGAESAVRLHLCFSLTKRERFEWILQKCTEVGVAVFHPFVSERSLDRKYGLDSAKTQRWQKIVREAAEQSERSRLPRIEAPAPFLEVLASAEEASVRLVAWEETETSKRMSAGDVCLAGGSFPKDIYLIIGPEGGLSLDEVRQAESCGFKQVSLGARVLRNETACIVASAIILHLAESQ